MVKRASPAWRPTLRLVADVVLNAIVGAAGLAGAWAALEAGKTVAVANKETVAGRSRPSPVLAGARVGCCCR